MFAYFQTYLRSLSKKDDNRAQSHSQQYSHKKKHLNYSQQNDVYQLDKTAANVNADQSDAMITLENQRLNSSSNISKSRMDTDRTVKNSLIKSNNNESNYRNRQHQFGAHNQNKKYYSGLNRSVNERHIDSHRSSGAPNNSMFQKVIKQEVHLKIGHNPISPRQTNNSTAKTKQQLIDRSQQNKKIFQVQRQAQQQNKTNRVNYNKQKYNNQQQNNDNSSIILHQDISEEDAYQRYLQDNNNYSFKEVEQEVTKDNFQNVYKRGENNPSLLQTVIQAPYEENEELETLKLNKVFKAFQDDVDEQKQRSNRNNRDSQEFQKTSADYMETIRNNDHQMNKLIQEAYYLSPHDNGKLNKGGRQSGKKPSGGSGPQHKREMTYESERSSIFNENLSVAEAGNRNNFNNQYANKLEEGKKSPIDISVSALERIDSARSVKRDFNLKSPLLIQMVNSSSVHGADQFANSQQKNIQQFLELNMRMQSLNSLNESLFLKNQFLRSLDLRNNNLRVLPDSVCNLNLLWKLRVDFNILESLPANIGRLDRLEVFTASNNKLKELPKSFYLLGEKITMIQLNDNLLSSLDSDLGKLTKAKVILLHNNLLRSVPCELHKLRDLHEFSLEWFVYLNPPQNKILKDERGQMMIKDFQQFCKASFDLGSQECRFVHFVAYFHKLQTLENLTKLSIFPKQRSILHYISLYGHLHLMKDVLKACPTFNLNYCDNDGTTALILAFKNKQNHLISHLMRNYPILNLNKGSTKYGFPLHIAIKNHEFKVVLKMLKPRYVVNINVRDEDGNNALHYLLGHYGYDSSLCAVIGKILLKKGIEVNQLNKTEFSPLHVAIKSFQNKSLKFALDYNNYLRKKLEQQESPFEKDINLRKSSINPFGKNQFEKHGFKAKNELFNFNIKGKNQWTPLHYAVFNNNLIAVELLINAFQQENIDIFARDNEGKQAQELCPFNSPIYKMIIRKQNYIMLQKSLFNENQHDKSLDSSLDLYTQKLNKIIIHHCLNRFYLKRHINHQMSKVNSVGDLYSGAQMNLFNQIAQKNSFIKRANSNGALNIYYLENQNSTKMGKVNFGNLYFGAQEQSDSETNEEDEIIVMPGSGMHKQTIRQSIINQGPPIMKRKQASKPNSKNQKILQNSKTQKNLHHSKDFDSVQFVPYGPQFQMIEKNNLLKQRTTVQEDVYKRKSPRILQQKAPLAPKQLKDQNDNQDKEIEEFFIQESKKYKLVEKSNMLEQGRFMSNPIDFETEQVQDFDNIYNISISSQSNESKLSDDTYQFVRVELQRSSSDNYQRQNSGKEPQNFHILQRSKVLDKGLIINLENEIDQVNPKQTNRSVKQIANPYQNIDQSFQSAPLRDQQKPQGSKSLLNSKEKTLQNQHQDQDDEEEDFCDAADEEAEAGALGLIANKINKFENHNIDQNFAKITEKEALKSFISEMRKKNQQIKSNKFQQKRYSAYSKQEISQTPSILREHSIEGPLESSTPFLEMMIQNARDEGNVFDTLERQTNYNHDSLGIDDPISKYADAVKITARNVKNRNNIFIDGNTTPQSDMNYQIQPFSRKSTISQPNNPLSQPQNQGGVLGRMKDLNRDCKLDDSQQNFSKLTLDDCLRILNDPLISMSKKYQSFYKFLYQDGRDIDDKNMKQMYDQLQDNSANSIFKVDLSYLMSTSKNKDVIPTLDLAINKYKEERTLEMKEQRSKLKSPEPTSNKSVDKSLKTPLEKNKLQQSVTALNINQSNCKKLIIYETTNAFDILMQEAMIQTRQMMDQCNQRINMERERSRERMKLRNLNSQQKVNNTISNFEINHGVELSNSGSNFQLNMYKKQEGFKDQMNNSNLSIREVPEFIARLNKSPSAQSIKNLKNFINGAFAPNPAREGINNNGNNKTFQLSNNFSIEQSMSNSSSGGFFHKKTSFTPKGSTGQVFLAFQKQKQQQFQNNQPLNQKHHDFTSLHPTAFLYPEPHSPPEPAQNHFDSTNSFNNTNSNHTNLPLYKINLVPSQSGFNLTQQQEENYNETIIIQPLQNALQQVQHFESLNHSRLQEKGTNTRMSQKHLINSSIPHTSYKKNVSSFNHQQQINSSSSQSSSLNNTNIAGVIQNTIRELQQQHNKNSKSINRPNNNQQQKNNTANFIAKQRELSQQIKQNLQRRGVLSSQQQQQPQQSSKPTLLSSNQQMMIHSSQPFPVKQNIEQALSKKTKMALNKLSPESKRNGEFNSSIERGLNYDDSIQTLNKSQVGKKIQPQQQQLQYIKYQKRQMNNLQQQHNDAQNIGFIKQQRSNAALGIKQVKYNLSIDSQGVGNNKSIKKSISTTKLTSDTQNVSNSMMAI